MPGHESGTIARAMEIAERSCREQGERFTEKRRNVLRCLLSCAAPLSAYEVVDHYREQFQQAIPVMSVYRMLEFLLAHNLVHKLHSTNKYVACSHITCSHRHDLPQFLICDRCRQVQEIGVKADIIRSLRESVEPSGFQLSSQQIELHGVCAQCCQQP
jgi:Fur family zinc uptake transcriptional regulator